VIIDGPEDIPQVTLEVANTSVTEGETTTITVFRDTDPGVTTTVDVVFTTTMGADWVDDGDFSVEGVNFVSGPAAFSVSVDILPNQTFATIGLEAIDDGVFEPDEQVEVSLVPVENGTLGADTSETVTIIDDGTGTPVIALENQAAGGTVGDTIFAEQAFNTFPNTATFTVTLDVESFDDRTITLQLDAAATGAAEPGVDYTVEVDADGTAGGSFGFESVAVNPDGTFSFTIGAGVTAAEVRFTGEEDGFFETDETVIVSIADADGLTVTTLGTDTFTYTLIDDDPAPRVDLSVTVDEISEDGGATSLFALLKDADGNPFVAQTDITVELDFGGNASIGDDYTADKMIVTIPEGADKSPAVFLESIDDTVYEGNETIVVSALSANITNAVAGDDNVATVTILEDETGPTVSLSVDQTTIAEANGEAALTLDLSFTSPVDEVVYVSFTTTDDDSVGTFPPNGLADWGTEARYNLDNPGFWPDDYLATTSSGFTSPFGADFPNGVELPVVTNPNNGMQALAIVIPAGAPSETVYLHALNDNATFIGDEFLFEKDETFSVSIDADSFENNLTADPAAGAATVTIEDDDEALAPNVDLAWGLGGGSYTESGTLGDDEGTFTVTLDAATNQFVQVVAGLEGQPEDYTIDFGAITGATAADNGDGTITLTFQTAAAGQTATVPFSIVDDNIYEIEETFNLTVEDVVFAKVGTSDVLTMTITDEDDLPSITVGLDTDLDNIAEGTSGAVTEGDDPAGPQIQFIIGKGGVETPEAVLVDYVISSGTAAGEAEAGVDFSAITSGTVTLARDDDAIAIVDLQVTGDDLDEQPGEDVTITLSNARFADSGQALTGAISGDTATLTITDDDYTPVVTGPSDAFVVSEGGFETITLDNLLYTDQDSVDDDLTYEIVTAPGNGFLYLGTPGDVDNSTLLEAGGTFDQFILGDGAIWYQHDDSETIEDSFFYTVTDGTNTISPEAEFNITVDPVNDAPEVESIIFYIQENTTGEVSSLFDGTGEGVVVTDQDGDPLTATLVIGDDAVFRLDTTTDGEVRLFVDQELDYEFQNAYALSVNVTDGEFDADTLIVVNVKDDASEPDPFEAGTIPTPDPILSDQQWAFQIPDEVFPDGTQVTYRFDVIDSSSGELNTSPWLKFASEVQTFWYNPDVNVGPDADVTYDVEVTATYWHQNAVIKGVSQASFTLEYDYIASLERSDEVLDALDFLEDGEADGFFLPEDGEGVEIQEMMVARAATGDAPEAAEMDPDAELAEVLALLEEGAMIAEFGDMARTA
ncbi:MAG: cadherin-like domain-containing protein, partial [Desulfococcaceae bacterium]